MALAVEPHVKADDRDSLELIRLRDKGEGGGEEA
jgi:hypothetical protein